jgi:DNA-dependent RNA polymerase auxiliary subunit epsilon
MAKYLVEVSRTCAHSHEFEVEAKNEKEARKKVMQAAYNFDFADGSSSDPTYEIESVEEK